MRTSLLAFATDLLDEGLDSVVDNVRNRAGATGITLATAYHDARDVFSHNPRRVVYFQEPGAVFFQPSPSLFRGLKIQPPVSGLLGERDLVADLVRVADTRGIDANAWIVLFHVDRGRDIEEFAPRNAFGDAYLTQLCPSNPEVQAYARALVSDVAARGVDSILLEAFHFLPFTHGYHHERAFVEITPLTSFLLSLCFCESCARAASEDGLDLASLRAAVQAMIRRRLERVEPDPVGLDDPQAVRAMFDGELGRLLDVRAALVTSLVGELVETVRSVNAQTALIPIDPSGALKGYAGGQPTGAPAPSIAWQCGVDLPAIAKVAGALEVMGYASTPDRVRVDLDAYAQAIPASSHLGVILRPCRPDCDGPENLGAKLEIASSLGLGRVDFYHYGLAPLEALDWIKKALSSADAAVSSTSKER
jgi:hypothetical protein